MLVSKIKGKFVELLAMKASKNPHNRKNTVYA